MPVTRRTKVELKAENTRLTTEVEALREFVFDLDLDLENASLQARRAALERFLQEHPAPEPFLPIKKIDAGTYGQVSVWRWARRGLVEAERRNGRWFARQSSVFAHRYAGQGPREDRGGRTKSCSIHVLSWS